MRRLFARRRRFMVRLAIMLAAAALIALAVAGVAAAASPGAATDTPDLTDDLGSWAALVGIGLPALTAILQRDHWPGWVNATIFGVAVVAASVVYGAVKYGHDFTWAHWEGSLLAIVVWGIFTYRLYWHGGANSIVTRLRAIPPGTSPPAHR